MLLGVRVATGALGLALVGLDEGLLVGAAGVLGLAVVGLAEGVLVGAAGVVEMGPGLPGVVGGLRAGVPGVAGVLGGF